MITDADRKALIKQDDVTLAEWYCTLNRWGWPTDLPDPEAAYTSQPYARSRRGLIMDWIADMVGDRLCSRVWNKGMTDEEHNDFWRGNMEKDPASKARYELYLARKARAMNNKPIA